MTPNQVSARHQVTARTSIELVMALLRADREATVTDVVAGDSKMSNPNNWRPCAGTELNWGTAGGQQSEGGKAASELPVNGVDAILLRRCKERGIEPTGKGAPSSMYNAVLELVPELGVSRMAEMPAEKASLDFARANLNIGVNRPEGVPGALPCLTFVDAGEGQHPEDFPKTFLSFSSGTKTNVPFVQGRHCVGSNGVLMYSGTEYYKLIVSRRYTLDGDWGWTLVRKRPTTAKDKYANFVIEYYAPDGRVPRFVADSLAPLTLKNGEPYLDATFPSCTVVRVYDYLVDRDKNNSYLMSSMFEENMVDTILPFRILNFNVKEKEGHSDERKLGIDARTMGGIESKIKKGSWAVVDGKRVHVNGRLASQMLVGVEDAGMVSIRSYYFDVKMPTLFGEGNLATRVLHSVYGQTHLKHTRSYLSDAGLGALKDRLVVIVDSSELEPNARNQIWSPNRESIKKTRLGLEYLRVVAEAIRDNPLLKELNESVMASLAAAAHVTPSDETIRSLARSDRLLSDMLTGAPPRKIRERPVARTEDDGDHGTEYVAKERPTDLYFRQNRYEVEIGQSLTVVGRTDASNDFFTRLVDAGRLRFKDDLEHFECVEEAVLKDGRISVTFKVVEGVAPDTEVEVHPYLVCAGMSKVTRAHHPFRLVAVAPKTEFVPEKKVKGALLPNVTFVTKDGREVEVEDAGGTVKQPSRTWCQEGLGADDGGFVREVGKNKYVHVINFDNSWHQAYLSGAKPEARREVTRNYIVVMRAFLSASTRAYFGNKKDAEGKPKDREVASEPRDREVDLTTYTKEQAIACSMIALFASMSLPNFERSGIAKDARASGSRLSLADTASEDPTYVEDDEEPVEPGDTQDEESRTSTLDAGPVVEERRAGDLFDKRDTDETPSVQSPLAAEDVETSFSAEEDGPRLLQPKRDDLQAAQSRVMEVLRGNKPMRTSEIARRAGLVSRET